MALTDEKWQVARLFPITGIGGADEQERRGCSAFLAVLKSVREFGRTITGRCGAPAGIIETFIEIPFLLGDATVRPDGLVRVTRGQKTWTALVEVKTGRNDLKVDQIVNYLDVAREQGFDAVITISHQIATTPGVHPVAVPKTKLRKVDLIHFSWSRIHTEARIQQDTQAVSDPDQAWILSEFVRFIESAKSGAWDFDDMGPDWVAVRNGAAQQTIRPNDPKTLSVVAKFDQLLAFSCMELSRQLNVHVQQRLSRAERSDLTARIQSQAALLSRIGHLRGSLTVPNAAADIDIVVDLRANRVDCSATISAPADGRPVTRVNWLLRQLQGAPPGLLVSVTTARKRTRGCTLPLQSVRDNPALLLDDPKAEITSFVLTMSQAAGTKRGQGRGSFVGSVIGLVDQFYADVVQYLKTWTAPAPKPASVKPASQDDPAGGDEQSGDSRIEMQVALTTLPPVDRTFNGGLAQFGTGVRTTGN